MDSKDEIYINGEKSMDKSIQILEEKIADKIKNYQKNLRILEYDEEHVDIWIKQFPEEEREIILTETDNLLNKNYINQQRIKNIFEDIWQTQEIMTQSPDICINKIQFLDIQGKGNSQKTLVKLIEEYYLETKNTQINKIDNCEIEKYIYLDDCMYTGFTIIKDINNWIKKENPNYGAELYIVLIGEYNGNYNYVMSHLNEICKERAITVKIFRKYEFNNNFHYNDVPYDILWPQYVNDEYIDKYIEYMEEEKRATGKGGLGFRNPGYGIASNLFTSEYNRDIFEKALLKKGAYIWSLANKRNERIKPMGYNQGISLGFGAFFATDFNISNNCPLAFWWGDMWRSSSETLGKWYPLLPREVNK